jgi:alanine racemase
MEEQGFFYRDTWAEVDLDAISENIRLTKELLPSKTEIIAVIKANAYGHGDIQTAMAALDSGATYLAVAFMDEAIALRKKGATAPILVLGATRPRDVGIAIKYNITLTLLYCGWLDEAKPYLQEDDRLNLHIKVDTGMGRIGVRDSDELKKMERAILYDKRFYLEGIFTHFATADELDTSYLEKQLEKFIEILAVLDERPRYVHAGNSATALRFPVAHFNAVRMGIVMYGLTPSLDIESELPFPLKEAFSLHSRLVQVKKLQKGDKVSYGATYGAKDEEWIGTIPIGYADGWIRKLQGQEVLVDGCRVPIVGRICMDQCMIKLPYSLPIGTRVTLIGTQDEKFISINEVAGKLETINYEVPCIISNRVPRLFKKGGRIVGLKNSLL